MMRIRDLGFGSADVWGVGKIAAGHVEHEHEYLFQLGSDVQAEMMKRVSPAGMIGCVINVSPTINVKKTMPTR